MSASWLRSGRAAKRKIYKKMYASDENFDVKLLVKHFKVFLYILKLRRKLVKVQNDKKTRVSYPRDFFLENENLRSKK